jgi:hypothetical protein
MNPIRWKREEQVAGLAFCVVGAIAGIFFAWMDSPFRVASSHALSGEWADAPNIFLLWLSHAGLYWPWPLFGALGAALAYYGSHLVRSNS